METVSVGSTRPHELYQKNLFSEKNVLPPPPPPPSRHKPARIHANLRGATTLYVTRRAAEKKFTKDKKVLTCLSTCP